MKEHSFRILKTGAIPMLAIFFAGGCAHGQKSCEQLTAAIASADMVPPTTKIGGPSCRFVTLGVWRRQTSPGTLDIYPVKSKVESADEFSKMLEEWYSKYHRHCGFEPNLGQQAAWCATFSTDSMDYQLLILRGNIVSAIEFHNWVQPPNPARTAAIALAQDMLGPAPQEAPLARPKE